jgi:hypothetical protein
MRIFTILLFTVVVALAWRFWELQSYVGVLPASIEVTDTLAISGQSGFREGCGVAVFRLSKDTAESIKKNPLSSLANARQARNDDSDYHAFSEWVETPHKITDDGLSLKDRWLNGINCAKLSHELASTIYRALEAPGSYYATSAEGGLIVIPEADLIVFSYEG